MKNLFSNWSWSKNTSSLDEDQNPKQGRWSRSTDAILGVAGKVTLLLILGAASMSSAEKIKNSYNNL